MNFLGCFVSHYYLGLHLLNSYESSNLEEKQIKVLEIQVGNKHSNESDVVTEKKSVTLFHSQQVK